MSFQVHALPLTRRHKGHLDPASGLPLPSVQARVRGPFAILRSVMTDPETEQWLEPHLCEPIALLEGSLSDDTVMIVTEGHGNILKPSQISSSSQLALILYQLIMALSRLAHYGIPHRTLSPFNIFINSQGFLKLNYFWLDFMTQNGKWMDEFSAFLPFTPPESIYLNESSWNSKSSVWCVGCLILYWMRKDCPIENETDWLKYNLQMSDAIQTNQLEMEEGPLFDFLKCCLCEITKRLSLSQLLEHSYFNGVSVPIPTNVPLPLTSKSLRSFQIETCATDPFFHLPREMQYHFWTWLGSSSSSKSPWPASFLLPERVTLSGQVVGSVACPRKAYEPWHYETLSLDPLLDRLNRKLQETMNELETSKDESSNNQNESETNHLFSFSSHHSMNQAISHLLKVASQQPFSVRERDLDYEYYKCLALIQILCMDSLSSLKEYILNQGPVPSALMRAVWKRLLKREKRATDEQSEVTMNEEQASPFQAALRQIEVDVPRCHPYDPILGTPQGQLCLSLTLQQFLSSHPQFSYWQGLDSVTAPLVVHYVVHIRSSITLLEDLLARYLTDLFTRDNHAVLQGRLQVLNALLERHDPALSKHLQMCGFTVDLFALPWILTLFTHTVFLDSVKKIWTLLFAHGDPLLPLYLGVSVLIQLREALLDQDFNTCLLVLQQETVMALSLNQVMERAIHLLEQDVKSNT